MVRVEIDWAGSNMADALNIVGFEALPNGQVRYSFSDGESRDYSVPNQRAWITDCASWCKRQHARTIWPKRYGISVQALWLTRDWLIDWVLFNVVIPKRFRHRTPPNQA